MESHYKSNSYHNSTHAADVLHAAAYLVKQLQDKLASHGVRTIHFFWSSSYNGPTPFFTPTPIIPKNHYFFPLFLESTLFQYCVFIREQ